MIPGMAGFNPAQMKSMMKQFGIKSEDLKAKKVIIELEDKKIIISEPQVTVIDLQGQRTFTVLGQEKIEELESREDIELIMQQTNCSEEQAKKALKESNGDLAKAIESLKKE